MAYIMTEEECFSGDTTRGRAGARSLSTQKMEGFLNFMRQATSIWVKYRKDRINCRDKRKQGQNRNMDFVSIVVQAKIV